MSLNFFSVNADYRYEAVGSRQEGRFNKRFVSCEYGDVVVFSDCIVHISCLISFESNLIKYYLSSDDCT